MAWVVCLLMGMGGMEERDCLLMGMGGLEEWVDCLLMGTEMVK